MDENIRPLTPAELEEIERQRIASDLALQRWKDNGGPQADNDARALRLQQQYAHMDRY